MMSAPGSIYKKSRRIVLAALVVSRTSEEPSQPGSQGMAAPPLRGDPTTAIPPKTFLEDKWRRETGFTHIARHPLDLWTPRMDVCL